jgi:copper resistance protein D
MLTALLIIARAVQIAASILAAGIFTFELVALGLARRPASSDLHELDRRLFWLAAWSLVAAFLSALLWFWLEVASMNGLALTNTFAPSPWQTVLFETQFGRVWQLRLGMIVLGLALVASGLRRDKAPRALVLMLWLLSVIVLVSLALISHAAAAKVQQLGVLGDALHLLAAGAWIGGLVPLAIFLTRARVSHSLGRWAAPVIQRFSTLSLCCVSGLIVSGICNSWQLVGSIHALFSTPYGRLLLFKLTLFGILIGFGARNRFVVKVKVARDQLCSHLLLQLRHNVICEACLGLAVVAIVACLGATPPAQHH